MLRRHALGALLYSSLTCCDDAHDVHLSVVLCGRNDNHAGDFVARLRMSLFSISLRLCRLRHFITSEIVLVQWRPPSDRPRFEEVLPKWFLDANWNNDFDCQPSMMPPVRVITVTNELADEVTGVSGQRRFFPEWQCKAVGLRRAAGAFLLVTNADTLWSPALFHFLSAARFLRRDSFYVTHPVEMEGPVAYVLDQGVPFYQIFDTLFSGKHRWYDMDKHLAPLKRRFPVIRHDISRLLCLQGHALAVALRSGEFEQFWRFYDAGYAIEIGASDPLAENTGRCRGRFRNFFDNQPGDFILAPREAWHAIQGPPMLPEKLFIDILVLCRLARRYRQVVLSHPCFYFHQAHLNATPRVDGQHGSELNEHNLWDRCCRPHDRFASEANYSAADWGFASKRIPESIMHYLPRGPYSGDYVVRELG